MIGCFHDGRTEDTVGARWMGLQYSTVRTGLVYSNPLSIDTHMYVLARVAVVRSEPFEGKGYCHK
jgi:translation elongation factor EF-Tu-like GTPase